MYDDDINDDFNFDTDEDDEIISDADEVENAGETENVGETENAAEKSSEDYDIDVPDMYAIAEKSRAEAALRKKEAEKRAARLRRRAFFKKIRIPLIIAVLIVFGAFTGVFVYSLASINPDRVMNNVYIEGIDVSNLTYDEVLNAISDTYLFENTQITLVNGDKSFNMSGEDIGLSALPEETARKAVDYCKTNNFLINGLAAMKLLVKEHVIIPAPQVDDAMLDAKLNEFGNIVLGELKQHYVEYGDDGYLTVYSGCTGYDGNVEAAREETKSSLLNEVFTNIHVTYASAPPDVMTLESFDALVYKDPVNARYEINGNEVTVVPGENGRYINKEEVLPYIQNIYEGCEPVRIPYYVSPPDVDSQTLQNKLFNATLSTYSTSYGGSTSNRCANVSRAASLINGKVLAPGDVFSFNDTVGHRTVENGFSTAKEYVDGKSVDGIGGGTCQVSSTLYSAVLYADMAIIERLNHMMTVGYIPLGQDATVSDGGVDFKFKNSSDYPVKISASTSGATITISIIGTAWDPPREVKISNSSSKSGKNTVVHSTRYVYSNGTLISTDTLNTSTYMPHEPDPTPTP